MTRERHIEYANKITELQKRSGETVEKIALAHADKLLKMSKGNLQAFKKLLVVTRKQCIQTMLKAVIQEQRKARLIGKEFQR